MFVFNMFLTSYLQIKILLLLLLLHPPLQDARPVEPGEAREQQAGKAGGGPHQRGEDAAQGQGEALRRGHHAPGAAD